MQSPEAISIFSSENIIRGIKNEIEGSLSEYEHLRITKEKDIPEPPPTITIGEGSVASPGNVTVISAAAKAGKTALTGVILAGAISEDGEVDGFDDLKVLPNPLKKAVIHFDTEQSESDQQYHVKSILKRSGLENTPDNFLSYNIRQLNLDSYQPTTDKICKLCGQSFDGIHMIVIDGGADYIASVNDEEQATKIVHYFTQLSIKYSCPVIIIIHTNPGSDKERGHIGSHLERKCYSLLTVKKEGDLSTVEPKKMRKAGLNEIPLIHFTFSKEKGYHVQIDAPDKERERSDKDRRKHAEIAKEVFAIPNSFSYTVSVQKIMQFTSKGERTAKSMISNMLGWGQISKGEDGFYRLVQSSAK